MIKTLIRKYKIYVVPGRFFGQPGHIRIGFGDKPERLENSLAEFVRAILEIQSKQ